MAGEGVWTRSWPAMASVVHVNRGSWEKMTAQLQHPQLQHPPAPTHLQRRLHRVQPRLDGALLLRHPAVQTLALRLRGPQRRLQLGPAGGSRAARGLVEGCA